MTLTLRAAMAFTGQELPPIEVSGGDSLRQLRVKVAEACGVAPHLVNLLRESWPLKEQGIVGEELDDGCMVQVALAVPGKEIITASQDGSARVWNADTGHCMFHLTPPSTSGAVHSVLLSRCGKVAVTGSADGSIRSWCLEDGSSKLLEGHSRAVAQMRLSPDGSKLLSASDDSTVRCWHLQDGRCLLALEHPDAFERGVRSVAFAPDGRCFVAAGANGVVVQYSTETGEILASLHGHSAAVHTVVFAAEGRRILSASDDRTARIWHTAPGRPCMILGDPGDGSGPAFAAAFSPEGEQALVAHFARCARLYCASSGYCHHVFHHKDAVLAVDFSPDGLLALTASDDTTCALWRVSDGQLVFQLMGHNAGVNTACFLPDGTQVLSASDDREARLWSISGNCLQVFSGHQKRLHSADFCR
ncbi:unnamed protein product [Cladocopium goreaui]|uniref:WD40 repeat protein n=1 Tax=Cladocopium goreaui TaxID=2562237 RepID=A0A9P1GDQ8_9DINO|nr:unnamed protein product [Cladocopium goreaui]